jgi:hypothetical protein
MARTSVEGDQVKSISEEPFAAAKRLEGARGAAEEREIEADADFVESAIEVALRETAGGLGGVSGAL